MFSAHARRIRSLHCGTGEDRMVRGSQTELACIWMMSLSWCSAKQFAKNTASLCTRTTTEMSRCWRVKEVHAIGACFMKQTIGASFLPCVRWHNVCDINRVPRRHLHHRDLRQCYEVPQLVWWRRCMRLVVIHNERKWSSGRRCAMEWTLLPWRLRNVCFQLHLFVLPIHSSVPWKTMFA